MSAARRSAGAPAAAFAAAIALSFASPARSAGAGSATLPAGRAVWTPPEVAAEHLTLADAIRLTLENAPALQLARQNVTFARGRLREATGAFDTLVQFMPKAERDIGVLYGSQLDFEVLVRRQAVQTTLTALQQLGTGIAQDIQNGMNQGRATPACTGLTVYVNNNVVCIDPKSSLGIADIAFQNTLSGLATHGSEGSAASSYAPIQKTYNDVTLQALQQLSATSLAEVPKLQNDLFLLGPVPKDTIVDTLDLPLSLVFAFRNGWTLGPLLSLDGSHPSYVGKPNYAALGGQGQPAKYTANAWLALTAPLARGGGFAAAAPERAARFDLDAALETLAQAGATAVYTTTLAYWDLAAAQERLALLERSAALQRRILELSSALVEGDEIPRADLDQIRARTADGDAALEAGRHDLVAARVALAVAIGLSVRDLATAPLAGEGLPDLGPEGAAALPDLAVLLEKARNGRADIRAASRLEESSRVLEQAACHDLAPLLNLSLQVGVQSFKEDNNHGAYWLEGYGRAIGGRYTGPNVVLALNLQIPTKNDAARGRYVQAQALAEQAAISSRNVTRQVDAGTADAAGALKRALREIAARTAAADDYEKTMTNALDQFRGGEITILNAIVTERDVTNGRLDLVAARRTVAGDVSRLRYQTGSLLPYRRTADDVVFGEAEPRSVRFDAAP
ncbi:MAG TPA: TolC family protein [Thermoanaerobaculia bacterium]|nr:TolC family protein [Thermoanaerobaculia bacterium]